MDYYSELLEKLSGSKENIYPGEDNEPSFLSNKRVLITGAAGSIGSNLSKKVARYGPSVLGLLDINESGLVELQLEISAESECDTIIFLSDISNENILRKIFDHFRPDFVFHTAAYKHVPVLELYPEEALRVNIIGTYHVSQLAGEFNAEKFVLISTVKAVNPVCIMGMSKKIAEKIVDKIRYRYNTDYLIVRFGNVIGSRGSASEIFRKQIKMGYPVTLTHPEMKRYFMTIPQAVKLILTAANCGENGNLFILDMNKPIYIIDIIREMIKENSQIIDNTPEIVLTGTRNGEKLDELLMSKEESIHAIYEQGFYRIDTNKLEYNYRHLLEMFNAYINDEYKNILEDLFDESFSLTKTFKQMKL